MSSYKAVNVREYNQALINCGSLTFWIDEDAIQLWKQIKQGKRGRPRLFSDYMLSNHPLAGSQGNHRRSL